MDRHPRSESHKGRQDRRRRRRSSKELMVDLTPTAVASAPGESSSAPRFKSRFMKSHHNGKGGGGSVSSVDAIDDHPLLQELSQSQSQELGNDISHLDLSGNSLDLEGALAEDIERRRAKRHSHNIANMSSSSSSLRSAPSLRSRPQPTMSQLAFKKTATAMEKDIVDLKLELAQAKAEIEQMRHSAAQILDENTCLRTELVSARSSEADLKKRVSDLEDDNADLATRAAHLREENVQLKQVLRNRSRRGSRSQQPVAATRPSLVSRSSSSRSMVEQLASAVESMLGSEIDIDAPETVFAESTSPACKEDEMNALTLANERLREETEVVAAERDDLKERLNRIMSVDVSTADYAADDYYDSTPPEPEPQEGATTSLRGLMTKMSSFRNNNAAVRPVESLLWDSLDEPTTNTEVSLKFGRLEREGAWEGNRAA